jgi:general secretion pathway protein G
MTINHPLLKNRSRRGAFTLLEVLVVVAIILILASLATVAAMQILRENKEDQAKIKAQTLLKAINTYTIKNNMNPPESLDQVLHYIEIKSDNPLLDPWGNPFNYDRAVDDGTGKPVPQIWFTNMDTGLPVYVR